MQDESTYVEDSQTDSMESGSEYEDQDYDSQESDESFEEELDGSESDESNSSNDKDSETELTEKGTKLDRDPMSALNQQLANERARLREYEQLLNNPVAMKRYLSEFERDSAQEEKQTKEAPKKPDRLETKEDLDQYHAYLEHKAQELETKINQLDSNQKRQAEFTQVEVVSNRINDDINKTLSKYPVLDPKSKDFDPEISDQVAEIYALADFNPQTNLFMGRVSFSKVAEKFMKGAKSAERRGSQRAQTTIVDRSKGRAISGSNKAQIDESNMSPSQIIASRMKRMRGK